MGTGARCECRGEKLSCLAAAGPRPIRLADLVPRLGSGEKQGETDMQEHEQRGGVSTQRSLEARCTGASALSRATRRSAGFRRGRMWRGAALSLSLLALPGALAHSQETDKPQSAAGPARAKPDLRRLSPTDEVWLDTKNKRVIVAGEIVLREGPLELFACLKGTKEHEAIVACATKAHVVHAGLLLLGLEPGHPVAFRPEYRAAEGPVVEVNVHWKENGVAKQARAQDWIRDIKSQKAFDQPWVFGGSGFWEDPSTKEQHYMAEDGDFICVSNFPSAMLDVPIESSQSNEALAYECFTDRIPPKGTKVTLTLRLKPGTSPTGDAAKPADDDAKPADDAGQPEQP